MARSRGFHPARSQKRLSAWTVGPQDILTSLSSSSITAWSSGVGLTGSGQEVTAVRIRGSFTALLRAASAPENGFRCTIGIGKVTSAAFAVGVTALPSPLDGEPDWDGWMYHQFFQLIGSSIIDGSVMDSEDVVNATSAVYRADIDTKAMRKLQSDEIIMGVIEVAEIGTATMSFSADTRMLIKLP